MSTTIHIPELQELDAVAQSHGQRGQPECQPDYQPDYIKIASPLVKRGFRVTPVHPETKCGVMRNWQSHQATSAAKVRQHAKYYPHHNVGVVGKRGIGRHCFLDIDAEGVLNRIESATGHKMPRTYTVCSRPDSAPYKRHYYFTQTAYSFTSFGGWHSKNINVKDMTRWEISKSGIMMHPTLYDVKGIGGGSLVVGAGSVRDTGEVYRCVDNSTVSPIPDWLVDWIIADVEKYRLAKDEEQKQKSEKKYAEGAIPDEEREELKKQGNHNGWDICEEDTYDFLRWRAASLAGLGVVDETLCQEFLRLQAVTFCERGSEFVKSTRGQELIERIAREKRKPGHARFFYKRKRAYTGLVITRSAPNKTEAITKIIRSFHDRIARHDALSRIQCGLEGAGMSFDPRRDKDKLVIARKAAGFSVTSLGWERTA